MFRITLLSLHPLHITQNVLLALRILRYDYRDYISKIRNEPKNG